MLAPFCRFNKFLPLKLSPSVVATLLSLRNGVVLFCLMLCRPLIFTWSAALLSTEVKLAFIVLVSGGRDMELDIFMRAVKGLRLEFRERKVWSRCICFEMRNLFILCNIIKFVYSFFINISLTNISLNSNEQNKFTKGEINCPFVKVAHLIVIAFHMRNEKITLGFYGFGCTSQDWNRIVQICKGQKVGYWKLHSKKSNS